MNKNYKMKTKEKVLFKMMNKKIRKLLMNNNYQINLKKVIWHLDKKEFSYLIISIDLIK